MSREEYTKGYNDALNEIEKVIIKHTANKMVRGKDLVECINEITVKIQQSREPNQVDILKQIFQELAQKGDMQSIEKLINEIIENENVEHVVIIEGGVFDE